MNVKQLIEKLQTLDPELMVVVSGYEAGVNEANIVEVTKIALNVNTSWYYGEHEEIGNCAYYDKEYADVPKANAVKIY
mgnify:CR=1 FL=1